MIREGYILTQTLEKSLDLDDVEYVFNILENLVEKFLLDWGKFDINTSYFLLGTNIIKKLQEECEELVRTPEELKGHSNMKPIKFMGITICELLGDKNKNKVIFVGGLNE